MIDKQTLKLRCSEAIDQNREAILAFADDIYRHPEMGYHEFRSTEKMKEVFQVLAGFCGVWILIGIFLEIGFQIGAWLCR